MLIPLCRVRSAGGGRSPLGRRPCSGPRRVRRPGAACAGSCTCLASGVHCDTPVAPWIWIASSMISHTRLGTIAFTALTHTRASALPMRSIALAAFSTMRRIASISMRALATTSVFLPSEMIGLPNASRLRPRVTISSSARSAAPIERMQWWMRPGPRRSWRDLEAAALAEEDVVLRHAHVGEAEVHVAVGRVVVAEHVHRPEDLEAGRVHRHEDLRLLEVGGRVRVGADHADHDLAARVAGAGDVVLLAVDHPLVAVEHGLGGDVAGVGAGQARLGHAEAAADLAVEQRLEPLLLLLGRADPLEHLHVAGVGRRAVEALGGQRVLAELAGDVRVVEVAEALAGLGVGEEEVPEPVGLGLRLGAVEQLELAGRVAPAVLPPLAEAEELLGDRLHLVGDERLHLVEQRPGRLGHAEVVELAAEVVGVEGVGGHGVSDAIGGGVAQSRAHLAPPRHRRLWRGWSNPRRGGFAARSGSVSRRFGSMGLAADLAYAHKEPNTDPASHAVGSDPPRWAPSVFSLTLRHLDRVVNRITARPHQRAAAPRRAAGGVRHDHRSQERPAPHLPARSPSPSVTPWPSSAPTSVRHPRRPGCSTSRPTRTPTCATGSVQRTVEARPATDDGADVGVEHRLDGVPRLRQVPAPHLGPSRSHLRARTRPLSGHAGRGQAPRREPVSAGHESGRRDSNPRPQPWQGCALPAEPRPREPATIAGAVWAPPTAIGQARRRPPSARRSGRGRRPASGGRRRASSGPRGSSWRRSSG